MDCKISLGHALEVAGIGVDHDGNIVLKFFSDDPLAQLRQLQNMTELLGSLGAFHLGRVGMPGKEEEDLSGPLQKSPRHTTPLGRSLPQKGEAKI